MKSANSEVGHEWGLLAAKKLGIYGASIKVAQFNAGDSGVDATKIWLTGTVNF